MSNAFTDALSRHRLSAPISWLLLAGLLALMIWIVIELLWLVLRWQQPLPEALPRSAVPTTTLASNPVALSKWHLFGSALTLADPRAALANAPQSSLQLRLLLVWSGRDPKQGRAILADANGVEQSLRVGAEVAPGVVLDQVLADRVVLSRGGVLEVLTMTRERAPNTRSAPSAAAPKAGFAAAGAGLVMPAGRLLSTAEMGQIGVPNVPMIGVDLEAVRKQLGVDPMELARQITALPVMENGKMVGVRLNAGAQSAALARLGLQPEDVVTSINGVQVTDPGRIAGVLANLPQTRRLSVAVRRNGKTENLAVDLN